MNEIKKEEKEKGIRKGTKGDQGEKREEEGREDTRRERKILKKDRWGVGASQLADVHSLEWNSTGYQYRRVIEEPGVH